MSNAEANEAFSTQWLDELLSLLLTAIHKERFRVDAPMYRAGVDSAVVAFKRVLVEQEVKVPAVKA